MAVVAAGGAADGPRVIRHAEAVEATTGSQPCPNLLGLTLGGSGGTTGGPLKSGNLLLSSVGDFLLEVSEDGTVVDLFDEFFEGDLPFDHLFGDMSNGFLLGPGVCRSPGFFSTHAGRPRRNGKGNNLTQAAIDAASGSLQVCGQTIDSSLPIGDLSSALEGLCVRTRGVKQRSLYRQLVAARLNCAVSGAANCAALAPSYDACDSLCENGSSSEIGYGVCNKTLDCFNNGGTWNADTRTCEQDLLSCHERSFCDSPDPNLCFDPLGPATSNKQCKRARRNECTIDDC